MRLPITTSPTAVTPSSMTCTDKSASVWAGPWWCILKCTSPMAMVCPGVTLRLGGTIWVPAVDWLVQRSSKARQALPSTPWMAWMVLGRA